MTDFQRDLEATLGTDEYMATWERGTKLDLTTVVVELLDELADE